MLMKGILVIVVLLFIFFAIGLMILFRAVHQGIHRFKQMMGMEDGEDTSSMHSRNYTGKRQQQYEFRHGDDYGTRHQGRTQGQEQGNKQQSSTSSGETIIDQRDTRQTKRKIFAEDEGEYVDYIEEK
jgi:Sec-independent protein translocase protein TatA